MLAAISPYPWLSDVYLTPVIPDDPLLQVDFELQPEEEAIPLAGGEDSTSTSSESSSQVTLRAKLVLVTLDVAQLAG